MHPYLQAAAGGVLIGLSAWALLAGLGRFMGVSGITSSALTELGEGAYWRWAFLAGLIGGGAAFASLLGVPAAVSRPPGLLLGAGLLVGFGTVMGSGCTSGHGVCGLGRRSTRSLVAVGIFMVTGVATVCIAEGAYF